MLKRRSAYDRGILNAILAHGGVDVDSWQINQNAPLAPFFYAMIRLAEAQFVIDRYRDDGCPGKAPVRLWSITAAGRRYLAEGSGRRFWYAVSRVRIRQRAQPQRDVSTLDLDLEAMKREPREWYPPDNQRTSNTE